MNTRLDQSPVAFTAGVLLFLTVAVVVLLESVKYPLAEFIKGGGGYWAPLR